MSATLLIYHCFIIIRYAASLSLPTVIRQIILLAILGVLAVVSFSFQLAKEPIQLNWMQLQRVPTRPVQITGVDGLLPLPVFPAVIKAYDGKVIEIDGYIIPMDKTGKTVVLSGYALAECFFCGKAGPASVMTIKLKKPSKYYKTDQIATFRGRLVLNNNDPKELFYILENAIEVQY